MSERPSRPSVRAAEFGHRLRGPRERSNPAGLQAHAESAAFQRLAVLGARIYVTAMQLLEAGTQEIVVVDDRKIKCIRKCYSEIGHTTRMDDIGLHDGVGWG